MHKDHLGSTDVITDETGTVESRTAFNAHGERIQNLNWDTLEALTQGMVQRDTTHRGFTGHDQER